MVVHGEVQAVIGDCSYLYRFRRLDVDSSSRATEDMQGYAEIRFAKRLCDARADPL